MERIVLQFDLRYTREQTPETVRRYWVEMELHLTFEYENLGTVSFLNAFVVLWT